MIFRLVPKIKKYLSLIFVLFIFFFPFSHAQKGGNKFTDVSLYCLKLDLDYYKNSMFYCSLKFYF